MSKHVDKVLAEVRKHVYDPDVVGIIVLTVRENEGAPGDYVISSLRVAEPEFDAAVQGLTNDILDATKDVKQIGRTVS